MLACWCADWCGLAAAQVERQAVLRLVGFHSSCGLHALAGPFCQLGLAPRAGTVPVASGTRFALLPVLASRVLTASHDFVASFCHHACCRRSHILVAIGLTHAGMKGG